VVIGCFLGTFALSICSAASHSPALVPQFLVVLYSLTFGLSYWARTATADRSCLFRTIYQAIKSCICIIYIINCLLNLIYKNYREYVYDIDVVLSDRVSVSLQSSIVLGMERMERM
jgi:hypothetical protein